MPVVRTARLELGRVPVRFIPPTAPADATVAALLVPGTATGDALGELAGEEGYATPDDVAAGTADLVPLDALAGYATTEQLAAKADLPLEDLVVYDPVTGWGNPDPVDGGWRVFDSVRHVDAPAPPGVSRDRWKAHPASTVFEAETLAPGEDPEEEPTTLPKPTGLTVVEEPAGSNRALMTVDEPPGDLDGVQYVWWEVGTTTGPVAITSVPTRHTGYLAPNHPDGTARAYMYSVGYRLGTIESPRSDTVTRVLSGGKVAPPPPPAEGAAITTLKGRLAEAGTKPVRLAFWGSSTPAGGNASSYDLSVVPLLVKAMQVTYPSGGAEQASPPLNNSANWTVSSANGVQGYNNAQYGATASTYTTASERTNTANIAPAAVFHFVGSNDYDDQRPLATYKADLEAAIADVNTKVTGPDPVHVLVHQHRRGSSTTDGKVIKWAEYGAAMGEVAAADPAMRFVIDASVAFAEAGVPAPDPNNLLDTDNVHLTTAGHKFFADFLAGVFDLTTPAPPTAPTVGVTNGTTTESTLAWSFTVNPAARIELNLRTTAGGTIVRSYSTPTSDVAYSVTFTGLTGSTSYPWDARFITADGGVTVVSGTRTTTAPAATGWVSKASLIAGCGVYTEPVRTRVVRSAMSPAQLAQYGFDPVSGTAANPTLYENLDLVGHVIIPSGYHDIVYRNVRVEVDPATPKADYNGRLFRLRGFHTGVVLDHVELDGKSIANYGIDGHRFTARDLHIHHSCDGIFMAGQGSILLERVHIHDMIRQGDLHPDAIQCSGNLPGEPIVVRWGILDCRDDEGNIFDINNGAFQGGNENGIRLYPNFYPAKNPNSVFDDVTLEYLYVAGGNYTINIREDFRDDGVGVGHDKGIHIRNIEFESAAWRHGPLASGPQPVYSNLTLSGGGSPEGLLWYVYPPESATTSVSGSAVTVSWVAPTRHAQFVTSYIVKRGGTTVATVPGTARSATITGNPAGSHVFTVQSVIERQYLRRKGSDPTTATPNPTVVA